MVLDKIANYFNMDIKVTIIVALLSIFPIDHLSETLRVKYDFSAIF